MFFWVVQIQWINFCKVLSNEPEYLRLSHLKLINSKKKSAIAQGSVQVLINVSYYYLCTSDKQYVFLI